MRPRVARLLSKLAKEPKISIKRAEILTEYYKHAGPEPEIIKRAKAFRMLLETYPISIDPDELIVGKAAEEPRAALLFPEYSVKWILEELDMFDKREVDRFRIDEKDKERLREILPYWMGKTLEDKVSIILPERVKDISTESASIIAFRSRSKSGLAHAAPNYEKVLKLGINGIRDEIEAKIKRLDLTNPDDLEKKIFYDACLIVCDAIIEFSKRYAEKAKELAQKEENRERRAELEKIAQICNQVPANPARTFHEALQSVWFIYLCFRLFENGNSWSFGRFDQYMYPYYKKDLDNNEISVEDAKELLQCFFIKCSEVGGKLYDLKNAQLYAGNPYGETITLGGIKEDGEDAVNELSYLCLDAIAELKLPHPEIAVRIHNKTPDEFLLKVCEVIKLGCGFPKLFNDEVIIQSLLSQGVPLEDARNYCIIGCVEPEVPHKTNGWHNAGLINLAKCLELALNDGVCRLTKKQLGPRTGDPRLFSSFEDVLRAFKLQLEYFIRQLVIAVNICDKAHMSFDPQPLASILIDDCLDKGLDWVRGGAHYNWTGIQGIGFANVVDSLAAIKKLVFEDKKITMHELIEALDNNFEGRDHLRSMLLDAPKYGNDDDYVDMIGNVIVRMLYNIVKRFKNPRGGCYRIGLYGLTSNIPFGKVVGALPDGRKACEPLADNISPMRGRDRQGPTAVFKSVAKLDLARVQNGALLNVKLSPWILRTQDDVTKLASLIRAYFDLGGFHVQFNVISKEVLIDAQKHPEKYPNLLVRVSGYCAYFVELSKEVQDDIIARTEHGNY